MFLNAILLSLALSGPLTPAPTARPSVAARPTVSTPVIRAQGHPMHVDFFIAGTKRADLRLRALSKGTDAAFTQWLKEEKPHVYDQAVDKVTGDLK